MAIASSCRGRTSCAPVRRSPAKRIEMADNVSRPYRDSPDPGETIVKLEQVTKVYHRDAEEVRVLEGLDLLVNKGEFVALMAPSGSGKTTLLNLIGGIDKATSGRVIVGQTELAALSEKELAGWRSHNV